MLSNFIGSVSLTSTNMDSDQGTGFNLLRYYQIWKWHKCFQHHLKKKKLQNNSILTWVLLLPCIILTTRWKNYVNAKGNILWYLFIIRSVGKLFSSSNMFFFYLRWDYGLCFCVLDIWYISGKYERFLFAMIYFF